MKKNLFIIIGMLTLVLSLLVSCGSDGENRDDDHVHTADDAVIEDGVNPTCVNDGYYYEVIYCKDCKEELDRSKVTVPKSNTHRVTDGLCSVCDTAFTVSQGLEFSLENGTYTLVGIGECKDTVVVIPSSVDGIPVTRIESYAFANQVQVESVIIPVSVTEIGEFAFLECYGLKSIAIPYSVNSMGKGAFAGALSLKSIFVDADNPVLTSVDGVLYSKNKETLIAYTAGREDISYEIPEGTTAMLDYSVDSRNLYSITIPSTIKSVQKNTFFTPHLVEIINHSELDLKSLAEFCRDYYWEFNTSKFVLDVHQGSSKIVTSDDFLFMDFNGKSYLIGYCGSSDSVTLPESYRNEMYLLAPGAMGFEDSIRYLTISKGVERIEDAAFHACRNLSTVSIMPGVSYIGYGIFGGCDSLSTLTYVGAPYEWRRISLSDLSLNSRVTFTEDDCTSHEDKNGDYHCDVCDTVISHTCIDLDGDSLCNRCHSYFTCTNHEDIDKNKLCDLCGATVEVECDHVDTNNDLRCDICRERLKCPHHKDLDGDGICNGCYQRYDNWDYINVEWDTTDLIFMLTENSNGEELSSTCKRYMAGEDEMYDEHIDTKVRERNDEAYSKTRVNVTYDYYKDAAQYGWGSCIEALYNSATTNGPNAPDMYCNFVYDMVAVSLKGGFANLYSAATEGDLAGLNYFLFLDPEYLDSGSGYMLEYMKSLSLSKHKMYCVASDYFTDLVRAFYVIPVNFSLMNEIPVDLTTPNAFNSDRTGDGQFTVDDFYELVLDGQWNYTTLAQFSNVITQDSGEDVGTTTLDDRIGFALSSSSSLAASGMLSTSGITIIGRELNDLTDDYSYSYPNPATEEGAIDIASLITMTSNLADLFNTKGVISVSDQDSESQKYSQAGGSAHTSIRNRFANNSVLFGGVVCLGSLEYQEYQDMKDDYSGFGVVPVPLYREVNPDTGKPDRYLTSIHSLGKVGAISASTYKFAQCTAFLDYQSTHSADILDEYYDYKLVYDIAGGTIGANGNAIMLQMIRENVRSSFDVTYEDVIGAYFSDNDGGYFNNYKWHEMITQAEFKLTDIEQKYNEIYATKEMYLLNIQDDFNLLPD